MTGVPHNIVRAVIATLMLLCVALPLQAQVIEPARGSQDRDNMLDAMRIFAEKELGAPVEFVVTELRASGRYGFGNVIAQRPGGGAIELASTPGALAGRLEPDLMDGTSMQALLRKSGGDWVAVHWAIGATDVWFAYAPFCRRYGDVIAQYCVGVD